MSRKFFIILFIVSISFISSADDEELSPPIFSKNSGFYSEEFSLTLSSSDKDVKILYTTDSSDPTVSTTAKEYASPIKIKDRTKEPNIYSDYGEDENSPLSVSRAGYNKPVYPVDKAMIVRAIAIKSKVQSKIVSKTYFVTTDALKIYQDLTVISIVTNPQNLFDPDHGIYVVGNQFIEWKKSPDFDPDKNPYLLDNKCNYFGKGKEWEKESYVTFFDKGEIILERDFGLRLQGSSTRNNPGKSFELVPRKNGKKEQLINNKLLPNNSNIDGEEIDTYNFIHLRCIYEESRMRNTFVSELIKRNKRDLIAPQMREAILFLDGEYWGLYEIMEKTDNRLIENHYKIPEDDAAVMKENSLKDGEEKEEENYINFMNKYSKLDLTEEDNYKAVDDYIDIDSFIETYALSAYIGTTDWPTQNYGCWRNTGQKIKGNNYSDGKWRFFTYDFDFTLGLGWENGIVKKYAFDHFTYLDRRGEEIPTNLFRRIIKNKKFQNKFVNVYCDYANEVMKASRIQEQIQRYATEKSELIANSQLRWWGWSEKISGYLYYKNNYINNVLTGINSYLIQRPAFTLEHMVDYFQLEGKFHTLSLNIKGNGKIKINTIIPELENGRWNGRYFSSVPVTITAIPGQNSVFKSWSGDKISKEQTIVINVDKAMEIEVIFDEE